MGYVSYARQEIVEVAAPGGGIAYKGCLTRHSSSMSSLTSFSSGNIVGYSEVAEYTTDVLNNDIGKIKYTYYNSPDTSFTYGGLRLPEPIIFLTILTDY
jgi:hypothetical protein